MITVPASEAETQLQALPDRLTAGEDVVITRQGRPIARLTQAATDRTAADDVVAQLKALRKGATLGDLRWDTLRDEGRR